MKHVRVTIEVEIPDDTSAKAIGKAIYEVFTANSDDERLEDVRGYKLASIQEQVWIES